MLRQFTILAILLLLCSCSKKEHFTIEGSIEGLGSQMVSITYIADGGVKEASAAANDGKFQLHGASDTPTLCMVEVSNIGDIATVVIANGDKIELSGSLNDLYSIQAKGNSTSAKISQWTAANARLLRSGSAAAVNEAIKQFVVANPKDPASTALMVTRYQTQGFEEAADSLLTLIDPAARPPQLLQNFNIMLATQLSKGEARELRSMILWARNDTNYHMTPIGQSYILMAFRNTGNSNDSVVRMLRDTYNGYRRSRLSVVEVSTARDSMVWKQSTARDSAKWAQTWAPGSVALGEIERLKIPRIPFFIVADSTGRQVYRGSSTKAVLNLLKTRLGAPNANANAPAAAEPAVASTPVPPPPPPVPSPAPVPSKPQAPQRR